LGYIEGKSYVSGRFANDDFTRPAPLVEELAAERVDVIVSRGAIAASPYPSARAYRLCSQTVATRSKLARRQSASRAMTGVTFMAMELSAKRVEVLKQMIPKASRFALLSNPEHPGELSEYRVTEDTSRRLGVALTRYLVRTPQELTTAFASIPADNSDAMIVFPDSLTFTRRKDIIDFAARARIPCIYGWTEYAESGGLLSYGPTVTDSYKTLALFVDKILKGADAGHIPIEQVKKITLTLNLAAARALGLNVPQSIFVRADKVIE
jgi:putative ABC transport system substrate-binding protein